jgi:hypothetical protein
VDRQTMATIIHDTFGSRYFPDVVVRSSTADTRIERRRVSRIASSFSFSRRIAIGKGQGHTRGAKALVTRPCPQRKRKCRRAFHLSPLCRAKLTWVSWRKSETFNSRSDLGRGVGGEFFDGPCPVAWCKWRQVSTITGVSRAGQLAIAGRLAAGSSLEVVIVSRVM